MNGLAKVRELVKSVYNNKTWEKKVNAMDDNQVTAIYLQFILKGKL